MGRARLRGQQKGVDSDGVASPPSAAWIWESTTARAQMRIDMGLGRIWIGPDPWARRWARRWAPIRCCGGLNTRCAIFEWITGCSSYVLAFLSGWWQTSPQPLMGTAWSQAAGRSEATWCGVKGLVLIGDFAVPLVWYGEVNCRLRHC
jgi:hypothetical protein